MPNLYNQLQERYKTVFVASNGMFSNPTLRHFFNDFEWKLFPKNPTTADFEDSFVIVWGNKSSGATATNFCSTNNIKLIKVEDGFLRSFGLDSNKFPSFSIALDDEGIFYDASKPSRLETIIQNHSVPRKESTNNKKNMLNFERLQLTKYNFCHTELNSDEFDVAKHQILVVGQVDDDLSLVYGNGTHTDIVTIANSLRKQYRSAQINLKIHPDITSGKRKTKTNISLLDPSIKIISDNFNPNALISLMDEVHVISSQMGFEALLLDKEVHCHGTPFYSGWGLTIDHFHDPEVSKRRTSKPTIETLFHAVFEEYLFFKNPNKLQDNRFLNISETIEIFEIEKYSEKPKKILLGKTLQKWKYSFLSKYIQDECELEEKISETTLQTIFSNKKIQIYVWATDRFDIVREYPFLKKSNVTIISVDNGFLRSISNSDDLAVPRSLCFDDSGIYYDSQIFFNNQLEQILQSYDFDADPSSLKNVAEKAITKIIDNGLSQYNNHPVNPLPYNAGFILVICQPQHSSATPYTSPLWFSNNDLIKLAYEDNPEAQIIIKNLPEQNYDKITTSSNCIIDNEHIGIASYLDKCSKVYVIDSPIGFEAILRKKEVVCYGNPFYSHRGLTQDKTPSSLKRIKVTSIQMFIAAYIIYPTYFDPKTFQQTNILSSIDLILGDLKMLKNNQLSEHKITMPKVVKMAKNAKTIFFDIPQKVFARFY